MYVFNGIFFHGGCFKCHSFNLTQTTSTVFSSSLRNVKQIKCNILYYVYFVN